MTTGDVQSMRQSQADPSDDAHQGGRKRPLHVQGQPGGHAKENVFDSLMMLRPNKLECLDLSSLYGLD
jgi:hypothetical protein